MDENLDPWSLFVIADGLERQAWLKTMYFIRIRNRNRVIPLTLRYLATDVRKQGQRSMSHFAGRGDLVVEEGLWKEGV